MDLDAIGFLKECKEIRCVNLITLSKRKFSIAKRYIFVGRTSPDIRQILRKVSDGYKLSKGDNNALKDEFGAKYIEKLKLNMQGGDCPLMERLEEYKKKKELIGGAEKDPDELLLFNEEKELNVLPEVKVTEEHVKKTEIQPKERKTISSEWKIEYIYDFLRPTDSIRTIKRKIYIHTKVPIKFQHIFYKVGKENVPLDYTIQYLKKTGIETKYPVDIEQCYTANDKIILGLGDVIPLDEKLQRVLEVKGGDVFINKSAILHDMIEDSKSDLYVCNLKSFLDLIKSSELDALKDKEYDLNRFYYSFIVKFFPNIQRGDLSKIISGSFQDPDYKNMGEYTQEMNNYMDIYDILESVNKHIPVTDIESFLTNCTTNINYRKNKYFDVDMPSLIDSRNMFDFFSVSDFIPYIKFKQPREIVFWCKVQKEFLEQNKDLVDEWNEKNPRGIVMRPRHTDKKSSSEYGKFATVTLYEDGKVQILISWTEQDKAVLANRHDGVVMAKRIINEINSLHPLVFNGIQRIPNVADDESNISFPSFNIHIKWNNMKLNTTMFAKVIHNIFSNFVVIDPDQHAPGEEIGGTISLRFINVTTSAPESLLGSEREEETTSPGKFGRNIQITNVFSHESGEPGIKINMSGIKSDYELRNMYSFLIHMITLISLDTTKAHGNQVILRHLDAIKRTASIKKELGDQISQAKKKIRVLQDVDPKLFAYGKYKKLKRDERRHKTFKEYSRLCQKGKYPVPMTKDELKKYKKSKKITYSLPYINKTNNNEIVHYVCPNPHYKYPGFLPPSKHPEGNCMICCHKTSSFDPSRLQNSRLAAQCLREDIETTKIKALREELKKYVATVDLPADVIEDIKAIHDKEEDDDKTGKYDISGAVGKYIQQYGKFISVNRIGYLPKFVRFVMSIKGCQILKTNVIAKGSQCFFVFGIKQSLHSFVDAVSMCGSGTAKGKITSILPDAIAKLKRHPEAFQELDNGRILIQFKTVDEYIKFLESPNALLDNISCGELLSLGYPGGLNIVVFSEDKLGRVNLVCTTKAELFIKHLKNKERTTVFIMKREVDNIYYPIIKVITGAENKAPEIITKFNYSTAQQQIELVKDILEDNMTHSTSAIKIYADKYGVNPEFNLLQILKTFYYAGIKVKSQIYNSDNIVSHLLIEPNILFPINPIGGTIRISGIDIGKQSINSVDLHEAKVSDVSNLLKRITKSRNILKSIRESCIVTAVLVKDGKYVGYRMMSGNKIFFKPCDVGSLPGFARSSKIEHIAMNYDPIEIDKVIEKEVVYEDNRVENIRKINYETELYELLRIEIGELINTERNNTMRRKILGIWKYASNDILVNKRVKNKIKKTLKLDRDDYLHLKSLVDYGSPKELKNEQFNFDFTLRGKLNMLMKSRDNIDRVVKELEHLANKVVVTRKDSFPPKSLTLKNFRGVCTNYKKPGESGNFCMFDTKHKLKLNIGTKDSLKTYLWRIANECIYNETKRYELLYNRIQKIVDKTKWIIHDKEIIMKIDAD